MKIKDPDPKIRTQTVIDSKNRISYDDIKQNIRFKKTNKLSRKFDSLSNAYIQKLHVDKSPILNSSEVFLIKSPKTNKTLSTLSKNYDVVVYCEICFGPVTAIG